MATTSLVASSIHSSGLRLLKAILATWLLLLPIVLPYSLASNPVVGASGSTIVLLIVSGILFWDYTRRSRKIFYAAIDAMVLLAVAMVSGAVLAFDSASLNLPFRYPWWISFMIAWVLFFALEMRGSRRAPAE